LVEEDKLELAVWKPRKERGIDLLLPTDVVVADKFAADANAQTVSSIDNITDDGMGLDIGPDSVKMFQDALADCKTVIWNGMVCLSLISLPRDRSDRTNTSRPHQARCCTIIGGGDTSSC